MSFCVPLCTFIADRGNIIRHWGELQYESENSERIGQSRNLVARFYNAVQALLPLFAAAGLARGTLYFCCRDTKFSQGSGNDVA